MAEIPYKVIAQYRDHPREFIEDFIFRYYPSVKPIQFNRHQIRALEAIAVDEWISIRSGRGRGKTTLAALCIPWYLTTRLNSRVVCTAPKADQLYDALWAEVSKWLSFSPLKEVIDWGKEKIFVKDKGHIVPSWYAVARTAKTKENFSGYHEAYQMIIADESSGIIDEILETAYMTQAQNEHKIESKTLLISNPTKITGYFFRTQTDPKWLAKWTALHFKPTPEELENDKEAQAVKETYGEDHDLYRVSVLGEFPSGNPMAVVAYSDVWAARQRELSTTGTIEIGVDVARFGADQTVLSYRTGLRLHPLRCYKKEDTVQTAERVVDLVRELRATYGYEGLIRIKVDDTGVGGGCVDNLRRNTTDNIEVVAINFGSGGNEHFTNIVSMMWDNFSKLVKSAELPADERLFEELCGRNWDSNLDNKGRRKVETKADFKTRVGRSPDRADSVILCFWTGNVEAKILPKLVNLRTDVFKAEDVRMDKFFEGRKVELFGSVWHEKSMRDSVIAGAWDKERGTLNVFWEGQSRIGGPIELISALTNVTDMYARRYQCTVKPRQFIWYGSRNMFGLSDGAMSFDNMKNGAQNAWRTNQIFLNVNFKFDLGGSIMDLNRLIEEKRLVIMPDLLQLKIQLETWTMEHTGPENEGHALCLALANIASMLYQTKRTIVKPKPILPYTGQQEEFLKKVQTALTKSKALKPPPLSWKNIKAQM